MEILEQTIKICIIPVYTLLQYSNILFIAETGYDNIHSEEEEEIKEPSMSLKKCYNLLGGSKIFTLLLIRNVGRMLLTSVVNFILWSKKIYAVKKKTATTKRTALKDYFQKYNFFLCCNVSIFIVNIL